MWDVGLGVTAGLDLHTPFNTLAQCVITVLIFRHVVFVRHPSSPGSASPPHVYKNLTS